MGLDEIGRKFPFNIVEDSKLLSDTPYIENTIKRKGRHIFLYVIFPENKSGTLKYFNFRSDGGTDCKYFLNYFLLICIAVLRTCLINIKS